MPDKHALLPLASLTTWILLSSRTDRWGTLKKFISDWSNWKKLMPSYDTSGKPNRFHEPERYFDIFARQSASYLIMENRSARGSLPINIAIYQP